MLRGQAREEDSVVLIDMASPEAGNGCSYGSTAQASEAGKQQVAPSRVGSSAKPPIDFVLVWEEDLRNQENPTKDKTDTHEVWRETFLENLCLAGLKIDQHDVQDEAAAVHYILLRAPWAVLCYYAEDLRLKLPLQL